MSKTPISFDEIPDKVFIPAIKVREIVKARPLKLDEKKQIQRGSADILIKPLIGKQYLLTRDQVINNFKYTNGKKIKTSGWESSKSYVIYTEDNATVMVVQIPLNHTVTIGEVTANESNRKSGDYIVCNLDQSGKIDRTSASIVSAPLFRKMCYIPMNEVIHRYRGSKNRVFDFISNKIKRMNSIIPKDMTRIADDNISRTSELNRVNTGFTEVQGVQGVQGVQNTNRTLNNPNTSTQGVQNTNRIPNNLNTGATGNNLTVVAQIHDAFGKRVGFVIRASNGRTKDINTPAIMQLANKGLLSNVTLVDNPHGGKFLRGIGMQLDNLPIKYYER